MKREHLFRLLRTLLLGFGLLVVSTPGFAANLLLDCKGPRSIFRVWIVNGQYTAELRDAASQKKTYYSRRIESRAIEGAVSLVKENDPRSIFQDSLKIIARDAHPECDQRGKPAFQFFLLTHLRGQLRPLEGDRTFTGHFENACGPIPDINESFRCVIEGHLPVR